MFDVTFKEVLRYCTHNDCSKCALSDEEDGCVCQKCANTEDSDSYLKVETTVSEWTKSHPMKTRLTEFMKLFPKFPFPTDGYPPCPVVYDSSLNCPEKDCKLCKNNFWDAEIE